MSSTTTKVVAIRLRNEIADYYADKNLKQKIEEMYEKKDDVWQGEGVYDELLEDIASKLGKDAGWLVSIIDQMVKSGYFYINEKGRLSIKGLQLPDDEVSVDLQIDLLNLTAREKSDIKRRMIKDIPSYNRDSEEYYIGNGGGA